MLNDIIKSISGAILIVWKVLLCIYRDIMGVVLVIRSDKKMKERALAKENVHKIFRRNVAKHPNKPCIIFEDKTWTFQDMENYSNRIGNIFKKRFNLVKGDSVAIFLENKPEFVGIWLGLSKIGVISALINTNLKGLPLSHSINAAKAKAVVYGSDLEESMLTAVNDLSKDLVYVSEGGFNGKIKGSFSLDNLLKESTDEFVECDQPVVNTDIIMFIYTSGTTGMPKPAVIKHSRYYGGGDSFWIVGNFNENDIVYVCLPIYHGNGGLIGIGTSIVCGLTVILKKKFSASNFWKDCIKYNCTVFIYVGEICRFLVNQPPSDLDLKHPIKKAVGNGLRLNVWKEFKKRFNVKCHEFYAASEGNCTLVNVTGKIGACGFLPLIHPLVKQPPVFVIKIDDQMNPIRDSNGFCIECKFNEPGLVIGLIGNNPRTEYSGYANNKDASNNKIINDVFKKGQRAFNSGDLMVRDSYGYMYFCDRLGDTYRWRGENVSTIEVENVISSFMNSKEVIVYGVKIPDQEGRAGMAAILESEVSDLVDLGSKIVKSLPTYARPLFIRLIKEIEHTGSFKAKKTTLVEENYDLNRVKDKLFYFDAKDQSYKVLTKEVYESILNGKLRL